MAIMQNTPVIILPRSSFAPLGPMAYGDVKLLMPLGDKPFVFHTIKKLAKEGVRQIFVIVTDAQPLLEAYVQSLRFNGVTIQSARQTSDDDQAAVLSKLQTQIGGKPMLMLTDEVMLKGNLRELVDVHLSGHDLLTVAVRQVFLDSRVEDALLTSRFSHHEKNESLWENFRQYPCGIFVFAPEVIGLLDNHPGPLRDRLIRIAIKRKSYRFHHAEHLCVDFRNLEDYLALNFEWVRERHEEQRQQFMDSGGNERPATIGPVYISPEAKVSPSAVIVGPAIIGSGCRIEDRVIIQQSLLRENVVVKSKSVVQDCFLDVKARISTEKHHYRKLILQDGRTYSLHRLRPDGRAHDFSSGTDAPSMIRDFRYFAKKKVIDVLA